MTDRIGKSILKVDNGHFSERTDAVVMISGSLALDATTGISILRLQYKFVKLTLTKHSVLDYTLANF